VLDAVALTPVKVAELPRGPLQTLLDQRPALARRLLVSLAGEVRRLTVHAHELMHKDAPARLATWLHAHCQPEDDAPPTNQAVVRLVERKSDVASQLGMTPETLSRLMRTLSDQGVIEVEGYTVQVRSALRRLNDPRSLRQRRERPRRFVRRGRAPAPPDAPGPPSRLSSCATAASASTRLFAGDARCRWAGQARDGRGGDATSLESRQLALIFEPPGRERAPRRRTASAMRRSRSWSCVSTR
jgi:hypothetical protein